MGVCNDQALHCLAEDLVKLNNGNQTALDQIAEHIARTDGRKLIFIPHHNQARMQRQRLKQGIKKENIHHGKLVNDNGVHIKRIFTVVHKNRKIGTVPVLHLKQAVYRFRLTSRKLCHTLCRSAGRCRKRHIKPPVFHKGDNAFNGSRFTCSRSAGEYEQTFIYGNLNGFALF